MSTTTPPCPKIPRQKRSISFMDQLPEELQAEILLRLPCKACIKCKSVSKRWLSIISQPCFIREFIRLRKTTATGHTSPSLLKQNNYVVDQARLWNEKADEFPFTLVSPLGLVSNTEGIFGSSSGFSLGFLPGGESGGLSVVGSSHDLLLCSSTRTHQKDYYVCNPLTKQWIQLPQTPNVYFNVLIGFYSEPFIGFGAEPTTAEGLADLNFKFHYKVIRMKHWQSHATVEIFSSEKGEWTESSVTISHIPFLSWIFFDRLTAGVATCGTLHWWWNIGKGFAVYDPSQNCIRLIESPNDGLPGSGKMCKPGMCRGRIRTCCLYVRNTHNENDTAPHFKVWESEDPIAGKWRLVHKVGIQELRAEDYGDAGQLQREMRNLVVILIHPEDGDLVYLVFRRSIGLCNMRAMTLTPLGTSRTTSILLSDLLPLRLQHWPTPISHYGRET